MAITTDIEWADSTLNIEMGCDGCELWIPKLKIKKCYAGVLHERYAGKSKGYPQAFDQPQLFLERLNAAMRWPDLTGSERPLKPWLNNLPRGVFLNDMGDTFTRSLPEDWLAEPSPVLAGRSALDLLSEMRAIIMLLTKRPDRMRRLFLQHRVPANFILMTSITSRATMNRLRVLLSIPAPWHGISFEPMWGPIRLQLGDKDCNHPHMDGVDQAEGEGKLWHCRACDGLYYIRNVRHEDYRYQVPESHRYQQIVPALSWVIVGGESGPGRKLADLNAMRKVRDDCARAGVPFFMKQVDKVLPIPPDLNIRQMPAFALEPRQLPMEVGA